MNVVYIYRFFRYFLRGSTNLKLREFEWILLIWNSWLRSSFSKWNTRLDLWYLPPVTLFNFSFSSVIRLCICFLHLVYENSVSQVCSGAWPAEWPSIQGKSNQHLVSLMVRSLFERYPHFYWFLNAYPYAKEVVLFSPKIHVNRDQRTTSVQSGARLTRFSWLHMS